VHIENPADEKALNIALNKAVGEWEPVTLADLLSELQSNGYDLGATGFDAAGIDELFSEPSCRSFALRIISLGETRPSLSTN
jgi:hypothetical protein